MFYIICPTQEAKGSLQGPELRHAAPENILRLAGDSVVQGRVQTETDEKRAKFKLEKQCQALYFQGIRWDHK